MLAVRADLHAAYLSARDDDDQDECDAIRETVAVVDDQLRRMGVPGRLAPLDGERRVRKRSTRRRQDAPEPAPPSRSSTAPWAGIYGGPATGPPPSSPLTLRHLRAGRRRRGRHRPGQLRLPPGRPGRDPLPEDRGPVLAEPAALRGLGGAVLRRHRTATPRRPPLPRRRAGTIPRAELRAIAAATYHQVWWPAHDQIRYSGDRLPRWDDRTQGFRRPRHPRSRCPPGRRPSTRPC